MADDRRENAIAHHVWMIACYVRGGTDDLARQDIVAKNVGDAVAAAVEYQRRQGVQPE